jgi:hypothetical protein
MSTRQAASSPASGSLDALPNGSGGAAVLAAGIGSFVLAVSAIVVWLAAWAVLEWRWRKKTVAMGGIGAAALVLLILALLLTFPPLADLF